MTIPDSVVSIRDSAFAGCSSLVSVTIPNSVTQIGQKAFYYCESLKTIMIPRGVTRIESKTFTYCKSLATVVIPRSVTYINAPFAWCSQNLRIQYDGTKAQWNAIGGDKPNVTIQCTDGIITN